MKHIITENREKLRVAVEITVFISLLLRSYYLTPVALLLWLLFLATGLPLYWKNSKAVFTVYLIIGGFVLYLLTKSISGLVNFWAFQGKWFM